jgi:hypothetical protein
MDGYWPRMKWREKLPGLVNLLIIPQSAFLVELESVLLLEEGALLLS